jgi:hypothetical protein
MPLSSPPKTVGPIRVGFALLAVNLLLTVATFADTPPAARAGKDDFMPYVELAPFLVKGKQLTISIHARSRRDRHYAADFAEEVVKVVYESATESTGKGLVIIGRKGEPHPAMIFRKFLALAKAGQLDPGVAARAPELTGMLDRWEDGIDKSKSGGDGHKEEDQDDMEFEKILAALPLPLEGIGAKLYQLAWREDFDEARVEAGLRALRTADLDGSLFARFDWAFYLPPRGAFEAALDELVADALKEDNAGFLARMMAKGVMLTVKGRIRQSIEAMRQGVLFHTVILGSRQFSEEEAAALTGAYVEALLPDHAPGPGSAHERSVRAVREEIQRLKSQPPQPPESVRFPAGAAFRAKEG